MPNFVPIDVMYDESLASRMGTAVQNLSILLDGPAEACGVLGMWNLVGRIKTAGGPADRVRYIYEGLMPRRGFRPPPLPSPVPEKSARQSDHFRSCGRLDLERHRHKKALRQFSDAIAHAPPDSDSLRLAYRDRSEALLALGKREACLLDVGRALALLPPSTPDKDGFKRELENRKRDCEAPREDPEDPEPARSFAPPARTKDDVPCASAAVDVVHKSRFGRCVVAARDVAVGETVALEEPYVVYVDEAHRTGRCRGCGLACDAPLPCRGCSRVMFCDESCEAAARPTHRFECPLMPALVEMRFDGGQRLALLTALKARTEHASWEEFRKAVREIEAVEDPLAKGRDEKGTFRSENYAAAHTMQIHPNAPDFDVLSRMAYAASMLVYLLKNHSSFFADCPEDDLSSTDANFWFVGGLLLHHMMTARANPRPLLSDVDGQEDRFGVGAYPFASLTNHSCAPNAFAATDGIKLALVALRPIKKGQQIFTGYGPHYAKQTRDQRRAHLKYNFNFECQCEACANDWPPLEKLHNPKLKDLSLKVIIKFLNSKEFEKLNKGDKTFARNIVKKLYENVTLLEPYFPCLPIERYQSFIQKCWMLCGNSD